MDAADKFVNNKAPKRFLAVFAALIIMCGAAAWAVSAVCADAIVSRQIEAMLAAGADGAKFTEIPSPEQISAGSKNFSSYGISAGMDPRLMDCWEGVRILIFTVIAVFSAAVCTVWFFCSMRSVYRIYGDLDKIREQCLKIADNQQYSVRSVGGAFSSVNSVAEGVDLIADRLNNLNFRLSKEKSFLGEFLTDFSHQMKTSIAIIRLNSDIISESEHISEKKRTRLLEEISENVGKMETLTAEALKLAKLNAGAVEYKMETSDLCETCEAAIRRIHPLLRQKSIAVHFEECHEKMIMNHDRTWLSEAVENIIKNSADHSECTDITVNLSHTPTNTVISVEDNGKGIPQEEIPHIFERFGKKSGSVSVSSVGIGMSIAKKIIEAQGGEIIVYSKPGEGTRFEIIFL